MCWRVFPSNQCCRGGSHLGMFVPPQPPVTTYVEVSSFLPFAARDIVVLLVKGSCRRCSFSLFVTACFAINLSFICLISSCLILLLLLQDVFCSLSSWLFCVAWGILSLSMLPSLVLNAWGQENTCWVCCLFYLLPFQMLGHARCLCLCTPSSQQRDILPTYQMEKQPWYMGIQSIRLTLDFTKDGSNSPESWSFSGAHCLHQNGYNLNSGQTKKCNYKCAIGFFSLNPMPQESILKFRHSCNRITL